MGFFSAILRVLKAMPIALFMLPRVDKCLMLDGFQRFDNGKDCARRKLKSCRLLLKTIANLIQITES